MRIPSRIEFSERTGYMRIIWLVWQSETSKFLDTEFDHARWSATFIFDAKKNATIGEDWPEGQRRGDDSLTRNLTVLKQLKTDNQWHWRFCCHHYVRLAQSSIGGKACDAGKTFGCFPQGASEDSESR